MKAFYLMTLSSLIVLIGCRDNTLPAPPEHESFDPLIGGLPSQLDGWELAHRTDGGNPLAHHYHYQMELHHKSHEEALGELRDRIRNSLEENDFEIFGSGSDGDLSSFSFSARGTRSIGTISVSSHRATDGTIIATIATAQVGTP